MAGLAGLLKYKGFQVSGSELSPPYPPAKEILASLGIKPRLKFDPCFLGSQSWEAWVVGNAVSKTHPEVGWAQEQGISLYSLPQALKKWIFPGKKNLVVAGTHGKTTTTALLAWALEYLGLSPTFLIGGVLKDRGLNFGAGEGPYLVLEGDEYDSAFFDKTPKFWHYSPWGALLTSVEYDHADIYPDLKSLKEAFSQFVRQIPEEGWLVFCNDDPGAREMASQTPARKISYGLLPTSDYRLEDLQEGPEGLEGLEGLVRTPGGRKRLSLPLYGVHNALNALGAAALLEALGFPWDEIQGALASFPGVSRRQEVLHQGRVVVVDDFAHHPTAVRITLYALRKAFRPQRLLLIFEPRTGSSRRRVFEEDYWRSLDMADLLWLKVPPGLERVPPEERIDLEKWAEVFRAKGLPCEVFEEPEAALASLKRMVREGDLVVYMSSAAWRELLNPLIDYLRQRGL